MSAHLPTLRGGLAARALAVLALIMTLAGLAVVPAHAQPQAGTVPPVAEAVVATPTPAPMAGSAAGGGQVQVCGSSSQLEWVNRNNLLPLNRWSGNMAFHSRTGGLTSLDFIGRTQRDVLAGQNISIGNMMWSATSGLSMFAVKFCPLEQAGHAIDQAAGKIGQAIVNSKGTSALFVGLLVVTVVVPVVRSARRGGPSPLRAILPKVLIAGLLVVMTNGAMSSTDSTFGKGSPGWLLAKASSTVNAVAGFPATLDMAASDEFSGSGSGDVFSCKRYVQALHEQFQDVYGGASEAAMPRILNNMWETTGLAAWKTGQFGNNPHADNVHCRLLDELNNVPVGTASGKDGQWAQTRLGVMAQIPGIGSGGGGGGEYDWNGKTSWNKGKVPTPVPNSIAFASTNDATRDVALVGWAVCTPSGSGFKYRSDATGLLTDDASKVDPNSDESCAGWWTLPADPGESSWLKRNITGAPKGHFDDTKAVFNWEPDKGAIAAATVEDPAAQDFLLTMHSNKAGSSTTAAAGFAVSAAVTLLVFGGLSLLVIVVKAMSLLLILTMLVALLLALLPGEHGNRIISAFAGKALGVLLLTAGAVLLFSVVGALTSILVRIGVGDHAFAPGSIPAMFWTGIAPLAAVLCISYLFKNVLKMPNPLSLRGAGAWLKSSGAIGGAVGGAVGGMAAGGMLRQTMGGAARRSASRAMSSVGDAALHKATGGRMGRPGGRAGMQPLARTSKKDSRFSMAHGQAKPGSAADETASATPDSKDATGKSAKLTPEQRQDRDAPRAAGEKAILAELGVGSDATKAEKKAALDAYYADRAKESKEAVGFTKKNGSSIRSALDARRRQPVLGPDGQELTGEAAAAASNGRKARLSPRHVAGALKDVGADKAKRMAAAFKEQPVKAPLRAVGGIAKTGAKVAGVSLGAAALGPMVPVAAAGYGAIKLAGKVRGASAARDEQRTNAALEALARSEAAHKQAEEETGQERESRGGGDLTQQAHSSPEAPTAQRDTGDGVPSRSATPAPARQEQRVERTAPTIVAEADRGEPVSPRRGEAAPQPAPRREPDRQ